MGVLPLTGIRVADFSWIGAGSYTTKMLADMGADVIKLETATYPDSLRLSGPFKDRKPGINRSGYFADRNTSKRSLAINVKTPRGAELVHALIRGSDIVANNFTPGTMEKLGFGYDTLRDQVPGLIYLGMSVQGPDGPERDTLGYGLTIAALTGLQHLTGLPGREPSGTGTNYPDHIPNPCHAAFAVMAALRHRRRTGQGQRIEIAQTEPTVALLAPALLDAAVNGRDAGPCGNQGAGSVLRGVYPCHGEDRWIAISVADDAQWNALCRCLGDALHVLEAWSTAAARRAAQDQVDAAIAAATANWDAYELTARLQACGIAAGTVQTAADVVGTDPQLAHRGHWKRLDHKEMGEMLYNGLPFSFASQPLGPLCAAPLLGEHTRAIGHELLGLDDAEIDALIESGVLA